MKDLSLDSTEKDIGIELLWIKWWKLRASGLIDTIYKEYSGPRNDVDTMNQDYVVLDNSCESTLELMRAGKRNEVINDTKTNGIISFKVQKLLTKLDIISNHTIKKNDQLYLNIIELKNSLNKKLLFLITLILLVTIFINIVLARNIIRPIEEMTDAVQRFHKGDVNARSSYKSENEFGILSSSFNNMVEWIMIQNEEKDKRSAELISANNELKQFAYISSHQLQHPLRTIKNFVQIIEEDYSGKLDETAINHLNTIKESTERMNSLIISLYRILL
jgi:methyl-accepting chemotaxis protein